MVNEFSCWFLQHRSLGPFLIPSPPHFSCENDQQSEWVTLNNTLRTLLRVVFSWDSAGNVPLNMKLPNFPGFTITKGKPSAAIVASCIKNTQWSADSHQGLIMSRAGHYVHCQHGLIIWRKEKQINGLVSGGGTCSARFVSSRLMDEGDAFIRKQLAAEEEKVLLIVELWLKVKD